MPSHAHAADVVCGVGNPISQLSGSATAGNVFGGDIDIAVQPGDTITVNWVNAINRLFLFGNLPPVAAANGTPMTGSVSHVVTDAGEFSLDVSFEGAPGGGSQSVSCVPANGGGGENGGGDESENGDGEDCDNFVVVCETYGSTRDSLTKTVDAARPNIDPQGLPGSNLVGRDPCELLRSGVEELRREINSLGTPTTPEELRLELRLISDLQGDERALRACERGASPIDSGEFGDGDTVFYFPRPAGPDVPWPIIDHGRGAPHAHAYAGGSGINGGSDRFFKIDGMPANLWTRGKFTILSGTHDRHGVAGSLQAGLTVGITPEVDLGVYGYLLTGRVSSTSLDAELTTLAAALGAYIKAQLDNGTTLGVGASQEFGSNDFTFEGAAGNFMSSLTTFDASIGLAPISLDGFMLTPSAAVSWKHSVNGAFTDSEGDDIPQSSDSTLAISGSLAVSRPMAVDHELVATVTPRAGLSGSLFLMPGTALNLPGATLEASRFTLSASAGVSFGLVDGGSMDIGVAASGLGGTTQGYSVTAGLRVPLN